MERTDARSDPPSEMHAAHPWGSSTGRHAVVARIWLLSTNLAMLRLRPSFLALNALILDSRGQNDLLSVSSSGIFFGVTMESLFISELRWNSQCRLDVKKVFDH